MTAGSTAAAADRATAPRPLRVLRALVIVFVCCELLDTLLRPAPDPGWLYHGLSVLSAAAAILVLFRPGPGVALAVLPVGSTLLVSGFGQDLLPLVVSVVVVCARAASRLTVITLTLALGYCVAWAAIPADRHRALGYLVLVALAAAAGFAVRALLAHASRVDRRIAQLREQTVALRAAERMALADELSTLLTAGLARNRRDLAAARAADDPDVLTRALAGAEAGAVATLGQLRGLVSTLRGREPAQGESAGAAAALIGVAEEVEDLLVAHGHPVELDLPDNLDGAGDFGQQLLAEVLREGAAVLLREAAPGTGCTLVVRAAGVRIEVELDATSARAVAASGGSLRAARDRVEAAGGSVEFGTGAGGAWLRAAMPVLADEADAGRPAPAETGGWSHRLWARVDGPRVVSAVTVAVLAAAALAGAVLSRASGAAVSAWALWALWGLALAGVAATLRLRRLWPAVLAQLLVLALSLWLLEPSVEVGRPNQFAIVTLTVLAVLRDSRWAWVVTAAWAGYSVLWFHAPDVGFVSAGLFYPVVGVFVGLAAQHLHRLRTTQRRLLLSATSSHDTARDEVRRELAGELHDIVAHQLSLITMQAGASRGQTDPVVLRTALNRVATITRSAQADLALLLHVMRTPAPQASVVDAGWLTPSGTVDAAAATLTEAGHRVRSQVDPAIDGTDPTTRRTLTRIVREATTNILRYAPPGSACDVTIGVRRGEVWLSITNPLPAVPRPSEHSTGLGLVGLDERARITGGAFTAGPDDGQWRVRAQLPLTPTVDLRPRAEDAATLSG